MPRTRKTTRVSLLEDPRRALSLNRKEWRNLRDLTDPITLDTIFVEYGRLRKETRVDDFSDLGFERHEGTELSFNILVRVKCRTDNELLCGEIIPFVGAWWRTYANNNGQPGERESEDKEISSSSACGEPWVGGGPNAGHNLKLDFPCAIFYRREFPFISRSMPGFKDDEGNKTNPPEEATSEIKSALERFDIVLSDEPEFGFIGNKYLKYEFQSAYVIQDPRPLLGGQTIGIRRNVIFIFGTRGKLGISSQRPPNWDI